MGKQFTIVTVCFNCEQLIERTIQSVLSQNPDLFEYIIIDGKSKDRTLDVINQYRDRIDKVVSEPDKGIYDAMNKGIALATGKYINFMNAGDYFVDSHVLENVSNKRGYQDADLIFGDIVVEKYGNKYIYKARPFYEHLPLHQSMGFTHQALFVRTELAKSHPFNLQYKMAADYDMVIQLYREKASFLYLDMPISYYDLNGASVRNNRLHTYETLCIDFPKRRISNIIIANIRSFKFRLKRFVTICLKVDKKKIIIKKIENNNRFIKYDI